MVLLILFWINHNYIFPNQRKYEYTYLTNNFLKLFLLFVRQLNLNNIFMIKKVNVNWISNFVKIINRKKTIQYVE